MALALGFAGALIGLGLVAVAFALLTLSERIEHRSYDL